MLKHRGNPALPATLILTVMSAVTFVDLPAGGRWMEVLQDTGHVPAFALITLCLLRLLPREPSCRAARLLTLLAATIAAVALGAVVEIAQYFVQRDASLGDVGRDACGAIAAAAALLLTSRAEPPPVSRRIAAAVLAGTVLLTALPLIECARAYHRRQALFPVLADFRSPLDQYFLRPAAPPFARRCAEPSAGARRCHNWALYAPYTDTTWAGPVFEELPADWRTLHELCIEYSNPYAAPFTLVVALSDRNYAGNPTDRYTGLWPTRPHEHRTLCLALKQMRVTPSGRRMDLGHVGRLAIAQDDNGHVPGFELHRVWLH